MKTFPKPGASRVTESSRAPHHTDHHRILPELNYAPEWRIEQRRWEWSENKLGKEKSGE